MLYRGIAVAIIGTLILCGCGAPTGDSRPSDSNLIAGINLLISNFDAKHPKLVTWDLSAVKSQMAQKLPAGNDTDAGWLLEWPHANVGELSQVIVPWGLLGQYPSHPQPYFYRYAGGNLVPQSTASDLIATITKDELQGDQYFGAVIDLRSSKVDSQWIIFTTVPYLPVTDPAYGFATVKNKQWTIVDFGTALVGCGIVPTKIESEFGFQCPPSP